LVAVVLVVLVLVEQQTLGHTVAVAAVVSMVAVAQVQ
jgi:hypothetical protein